MGKLRDGVDNQGETLNKSAIEDGKIDDCLDIFDTEGSVPFLYSFNLCWVETDSCWVDNQIKIFCLVIEFSFLGFL